MADNSTHPCKQEKVIEIILDKLESIDMFRDVITEIKTMIVVQKDHLAKLDIIIERQDARSESQDKALTEISNNMKVITEEQKSMKNDIKELKDERNFNIMQYIKNIAIPAIVGAGIVYLIMKATGKI